MIAARSVFLGPSQTIWAFQVGFSGALVFGLVQLVLSDHDGPIDRRDWWGLAAGAVRRSPRESASRNGHHRRARHARAPRLAAGVVPTGVRSVFCTGARWLHYTGTDQASVHDPSVLWAWFRTGVAGMFEALGQVAIVGWAIGLMLVAGGVFAWRQYGADERRRRPVLPAAMLVGSALFLMVTGVNRAWIGTQPASSSRYMHITTALLLPSLAVAGDALVRRSARPPIVVPLLFLIGIPGNITATGENFLPPRFFASYAADDQVAAPRGTRATCSRDFNPEPINGPGLTVGWLVDAARSGAIPQPHHPPTLKQDGEYRLRLSLEQEQRGVASSSCRPLFAYTAIADRRPGPVVRRRRPRADRAGQRRARRLVEPGRVGAYAPLGWRAPHVDRRGRHATEALDLERAVPRDVVRAPGSAVVA